MIRIPDTPGLAGTQINAPDARQANMRLGPALAVNAALNGPVAEAIGGVGQAFQGVADQAQKLENARAESEARMQMDSGYAQLQIDLEKDPDPVSRIEKTRAFFEQSKGVAENPNLSPQVRDSLRQFHTEFAHKGTIRATEDAAALTQKRAGLQLSNELTAAKTSQNPEAYGRALDTAEQGGLILPEQRESLERDYEETVSRTNLGLSIENEPALVAKDLESEGFFARNPGVGPDDLPKLKAAVRASSERKRAEEMDLVETALEMGKPVSDEDLEAAEYLTPLDVAKIRNTRDMEKSPAGSVHAKAWDVLFAQREKFDDPSVTDDQYAAAWNQTRAEVLGMIPSKYQGDIKSELQYRSPANRQLKREKPDTTFTKEDLVGLGHQAAVRAREAGVFGDAEDKDFSKRESVYRKAEDIRLQVKQFVTTYPESTPDQVREYTDKLIGVKIDGDTSLLPAVPPAFDFNADIDRLINMTPIPGLAPGPGGSNADLLPPKP
jgi:hypothetical protein